MRPLLRRGVRPRGAGFQRPPPSAPGAAHDLVVAAEQVLDRDTEQVHQPGKGQQHEDRHGDQHVDLEDHRHAEEVLGCTRAEGQHVHRRIGN